jgi:AcrR family transcriptional regulator
MAPRLVSDEQLMDGLTDLFRERGFEAASLGDIAAATGLRRSSLYHRFPGGKQQMAAEVVDHVRGRLTDTVLAPLSEPGELRDRVKAVGRLLERFYEGGAKSCLLESFSLGDPGVDASTLLRGSAEAWIEAFAGVACQSGASRPEARARAQDALASIEGALVVARVTGDRTSFTRAIRRLPDVLGVPA